MLSDFKGIGYNIFMIMEHNSWNKLPHEKKKHVKGSATSSNSLDTCMPILQYLQPLYAKYMIRVCISFMLIKFVTLSLCDML